jgi:PQQ enzyme repeat
VPEYDPQARPGDNLYTTAVAIDINTGKLVWYYQYLPNDSWDYDEIGIVTCLRQIGRCNIRWWFVVIGRRCPDAARG